MISTPDSPRTTGHGDSSSHASGEVALAQPQSSATSVRPGPLPHAFKPIQGAARQRVTVRNTNRDFVVDEQLHLEASESGQHLYLQIACCGLSTAEMAKQLARLTGVTSADIGYAGMKDKFAVTRQWFSVPSPAANAAGYPEFQAAVDRLPRAAGDWQSLGADDELASFAVTDLRWQKRKLRRGDHDGNRFSIRLLGATLDDRLERSLASLSEQGAPNYFGHQRFGNDGNNVQRALIWLPGQRRSRRSFQRGLHLSVLRAHLFNRVLARRVEEGSWNVCLPGEDSMEGVPSGPMWGRGRLTSRAEAVDLERACLLPWWPVALALEHTGLQQQRRALVAMPHGLQWQAEPDIDSGTGAVRVEFSLPPGSYATSILRELVCFSGDLTDE